MKMKPNLFRSIANNVFIQKEAFYQRIRKYFVFLLCVYITAGLYKVFSTDGVEIYVQPNIQSLLLNQPITRYQSVSITQAGQLYIKNPNFYQLFLFPDKWLDFDLITIFCNCVGCIIIILIMSKLGQKMVFRKDISLLIRLLGFLILFHAIFSIYRLIVYIPNEIDLLTNHEFIPLRNHPLNFFAEVYISLVVIAISNMYKNGIELQKELDLTV